jgi:uncharacterized radical SAM protein YgiQ
MNTASAKSAAEFLPMSRREMQALGWDRLDVLLINGDAYVDHPSFGAAVIGRVLEAAGLRVGMVAQPKWDRPEALTEMGTPRLFVGITSGNIDSMVSNYTAARRKRKQDVYSPGGHPGLRPNRATMVYAQLARRAFPGVPTVLGGIEASMRRVVHYDYWQDALRPSILQDSKADILVYGMGETAILEIARRLLAGESDLRGIRGTAYLLGAKLSQGLDPASHLCLPSYEECLADKQALLRLTQDVEAEQNPFCARPLLQLHGQRALIVEPPNLPMKPEELDGVYALPFARAPHPSYQEAIPAFEMIRDSITIVRGCCGGCSFCGLGLHQGKYLTSRSEKSVEAEVSQLQGTGTFRGTVSDLGGPSANLYGCENGLSSACRTCRRPSCLYPSICRHLRLDDSRAVALLRAVRKTPGVKHVFVNSGVRMDVALRTPAYLKELVRHHVSGHLKVAPEHLHPEVLRKMRKPAGNLFAEFRREFEKENRACGKKQYIVPYFISNFPGCTEKQMQAVQDLLDNEGWNLQQVQDFIPLPMTAAAAMYVTGLDYETGRPIEVKRGLAERRPQMQQLRRGGDNRRPKAHRGHRSPRR